MPTPLQSRSLALALLASTSLACSEAGLGAAQPARLDAALSCAAEGGHGGWSFSPCDILETACQARIAAIAACQWGGPGAAAVQPVVHTLSKAEYQAQLQRGAPQEEQARALRRAVDVSLALFGWIDGGDLSVDAVVERTAAEVLAYYDPPSKSITIIEHGSGTHQLEANATLLHEMVHALQDTAHDLEGLRRSAASGSSDGDLALRSLVEGEAKFHDLLFSASASGELPTAESFQQQLEQRRMLSEELLLEGSSVLSSALQSVPYLYGPEWALARWLEGGSAALRAAYAAVPAELLSVLHGSWGEESSPAPVSQYPAPNVYSSGAAPAQDSELIPLAYDRLGAYTVYTAARLSGDASAARRLALGWRGDQLDVYQLDSGGAAARWHVGFDGTQRAATFAGLLERNPGVSVRQLGPSIVAVVSESGSKPEWLFGPAAR